MSGPLVATPFHDLGEYLAIPRVTGLRLAPDGRWLAASVQTLSADKAKYVTSIWRIDAAGGPPVRLTRSAEGEGSPRFLSDGSLVFISTRPDPDGGPGGSDASSGFSGSGFSGSGFSGSGCCGGGFCGGGLCASAGAGPAASKGDKPSAWLLPAGGGEARMIAALPGGITAVETASGMDSDSGVVVASPVLSAVGADGGADDGATAAADAWLRARRSAAGVTAILHESGPVRYWDKDLGPEDTRLFALNPSPRDLTPDAHHSFIEQTYAVSPDGTHVATGWYRWRGAAWNSELVVIEVATGKRTVLLADPDADYYSPAFSPDGRSVVCMRAAHDSVAGPGDITLVVTGIDADAPETVRADPAGADPAGPDLAGGDGNGEARDLVPGFDRWPVDPVWEPGGRFVYFTADDHGRRPAFRVDIRTGRASRVTGDDGVYADLAPSPDGRHLFALRSALDEPPVPVRIDLATGEWTRLASPVPALRLPGRVTEIHATADDSHPIRSWLVLPEPPPAAPEPAVSPASAVSPAPAPLVLWVHGGPSTSWNGWHWRWNPWLMAAQGYAVLLPDPALSSGYGIDFIRRGYRQWGPRPFSDLMAATDAAVARPDIDGTRTAMMGGSYGGYMANWIAGHTGRFRAIVSHAGLWALDQMFATTDLPMAWYPQFCEQAHYDGNSPHLHVADIATPMLVVHGDKDYRVPVGEALRLWWDLSRHGKTGQFLYFPDQGHWILTPGNVRAWYETVFAFLARYVLGEPWRRPDLL